MSGKQLLRFRAGPGAADMIQRDGFKPELIGTIAGASGGAKWLALSQVDRVIIRRILPELRGPVHLIGSSVGAWRFSCYAQADPLQALLRFEEAYVEQRYSESPDIDEITAMSYDVLGTILGERGVQEILSNPVFRTHIMTVRSGILATSEKKPVLATSMLLAAASNLLVRRSLGAFFSRGLFYDSRERPPFFSPVGFPLEQIPLTERNYADAVMATGAIPLVLHGVRDIDGARPGVYRDGGIIDYHLDLDTSSPNRITLFPHFFDRLIPGWFDKKLKWRKPRPEYVERTLLICPSDEFVAQLPNAKIPDRTDFQTMTPEVRRKVWRQVIAACEALAEDLEEVLDSNNMAARLEPL